MDLFISDLTKSLPNGWTRDKARERELRSYSAPTFAFHVKEHATRPAARLFLVRQASTFSVSNVVPEKVGELTKAQYNSIVEEFSNICAPVAVKLQFRVNLTPDLLDIAQLLTPRSKKALDAFERMANRGSLHPLDSQRWRKFLILAFDDNVDLDSQMLARWFVEEQHWPEDYASKLAIQYEFSFELLKDYSGSK